jgi:branched-chain amino acid aminotransferase
MSLLPIQPRRFPDLKEWSHSKYPDSPVTVILFLNGHFQSEDQIALSWQDRGFLYGDGLFETVLARHGRPFAWEAHWDRLQAGADALRLTLGWTRAEMKTFATRLLEENQMKDAVLRLALSRGVGPRGYSPRGADHPNFLMTVHPAPVHVSMQPMQWRMRSSSRPLYSRDPLAPFKTANKLNHVLARMEAEEHGADEALLYNEKDQLVEAASGNVFFLQDRNLLTPPLTTGALPGVTRSQIMDLWRHLGGTVEEALLRRETLPSMTGGMVTMSTWGIVVIKEVDGCPLAGTPALYDLHAAFHRLVDRECEAG